MSCSRIQKILSVTEKMSKNCIIIILSILPFLTGCDGSDDNSFVAEIKLENHIFTPSEVRVPAGKKIKLVIHNMDPSIEEFESPALKREKIMKSKSTTNIILAPLKEGRYDFEGEFHAETAQGTVIVE